MRSPLGFNLLKPGVAWIFQSQRYTKELTVFVDTDFGGCQTTRRSTSGVIALRGSHPVKHWSITQTTVALSTGEAELGGICRGASIALGIQGLAEDLGIELDIHIFTDAIAAIGIFSEAGPWQDTASTRRRSLGSRSDKEGRL